MKGRLAQKHALDDLKSQKFTFANVQIDIRHQGGPLRLRRKSAQTLT